MAASSVWMRLKSRSTAGSRTIALACLLPTAFSCAARKPPASQDQGDYVTDHVIHTIQLERSVMSGRGRVSTYWTADVPEQFVIELVGEDGPRSCREKIEAGAISCMVRFDDAQIRARKSGDEIIWWLSFDAAEPPFKQRTWHFGTAAGEPPGMTEVKELH